VGAITFEVATGTAAIPKPHRTLAFAVASRADLTRRTGETASPAVTAVGVEVSAGPGTFVLAHGTGGFTSAVGADLTRRTGEPAGPAMSPVALQVSTRATAVGLPRLA
jgi:hypothetical protein